MGDRDTMMALCSCSLGGERRYLVRRGVVHQMFNSQTIESRYLQIIAASGICEEGNIWTGSDGMERALANRPIPSSPEDAPAQLHRKHTLYLYITLDP